MTTLNNLYIRWMSFSARTRLGMAGIAIVGTLLIAGFLVLYLVLGKAVALAMAIIGLPFSIIALMSVGSAVWLGLAGSFGYWGSRKGAKIMFGSWAIVALLFVGSRVFFYGAGLGQWSWLMTYAAFVLIFWPILSTVIAAFLLVFDIKADRRALYAFVAGPLGIALLASVNFFQYNNITDPFTGELTVQVHDPDATGTKPVNLLNPNLHFVPLGATHCAAHPRYGKMLVLDPDGNEDHELLIKRLSENGVNVGVTPAQTIPGSANLVTPQGVANTATQGLQTAGMGPVGNPAGSTAGIPTTTSPALQSTGLQGFWNTYQVVIVITFVCGFLMAIVGAWFGHSVLTAASYGTFGLFGGFGLSFLAGWVQSGGDFAHNVRSPAPAVQAYQLGVRERHWLFFSGRSAGKVDIGLAKAEGNPWMLLNCGNPVEPDAVTQFQYKLGETPWRDIVVRLGGGDMVEIPGVANPLGASETMLAIQNAGMAVKPGSSWVGATSTFTWAVVGRKKSLVGACAAIGSAFADVSACADWDLISSVDPAFAGVKPKQCLTEAEEAACDKKRKALKASPTTAAPVPPHCQP